MSGHEGNDPDRRPETQDGPTFSIRRDDDKTFKSILLILGFLVSLLGLAFVVFTGINNRTDATIQNERIERINADNRLGDRIDQCCRRR